MLEDDKLNQWVAKRYAGWNGELGQQILQGKLSLEQLAKHVQVQQLAPKHQSGHQEMLENLINDYLYQ